MTSNTRLSILKPGRPREPLQDLSQLLPTNDDEETTTTDNHKRRVSFACVNKVKEFETEAECTTLRQTPAYDERFSLSSDSYQSSLLSEVSHNKSTFLSYADASKISNRSKAYGENIDVVEVGLHNVSRGARSPGIIGGGDSSMDITSVIVRNEYEYTDYDSNSESYYPLNLTKSASLRQSVAEVDNTDDKETLETSSMETTEALPCMMTETIVADYESFSQTMDISIEEVAAEEEKTSRSSMNLTMGAEKVFHSHESTTFVSEKDTQFTVDAFGEVKDARSQENIFVKNQLVSFPEDRSCAMEEDTSIFRIQNLIVNKENNHPLSENTLIEDESDSQIEETEVIEREMDISLSKSFAPAKETFCSISNVFENTKEDIQPAAVLENQEKNLQSSVVFEELEKNLQPAAVFENQEKNLQSSVVFEDLEKSLQPAAFDNQEKKLQSSVVFEDLEKSLQPTAVLENQEKKLQPSVVFENQEKKLQPSVVFEDLEKSLQPTAVLENQEKKLQPSVVFESQEKKLQPSVVFENQEKNLQPTLVFENQERITQPAVVFENQEKNSTLTGTSFIEEKTGKLVEDGVENEPNPPLTKQADEENNSGPNKSLVVETEMNTSCAENAAEDEKHPHVESIAVEEKEESHSAESSISERKEQSQIVASPVLEMEGQLQSLIHSILEKKEQPLIIQSPGTKGDARVESAENSIIEENDVQREKVLSEELENCQIVENNQMEEENLQLDERHVEEEPLIDISLNVEEDIQQHVEMENHSKEISHGGDNINFQPNENTVENIPSSRPKKRKSDSLFPEIPPPEPSPKRPNMESKSEITKEIEIIRDQIKKALQSEIPCWTVISMNDSEWKFGALWNRLQLVITLSKNDTRCTSKLHFIKKEPENGDVGDEILRVAIAPIIRNYRKQMNDLCDKLEDVIIFMKLTISRVHFAENFAKNFSDIIEFENISLHNGFASFLVGSYKSHLLAKILVDMRNIDGFSDSSIEVKQHIGSLDEAKVRKIFFEARGDFDFFSKFVRNLNRALMDV